MMKNNVEKKVLEAQQEYSDICRRIYSPHCYGDSVEGFSKLYVDRYLDSEQIRKNIEKFLKNS